jgi:hypothetical protein
VSKSTPSRPGGFYQPKEPDTSRKGILAPTLDAPPMAEMPALSVTPTNNTADNMSDNVITSDPVKRRKSDGMRQVGFRMPGDTYSDFVAWCHANEYAVGPTAGAALREYMARHGGGE